METKSTGLIYTRMTQVMNDIDAIGKGRNNAQQGFKFRGIDDIYNELHSVLAKHKVFTIPTILNRSYKERTTAKGTIMNERILTIRYRFYAEDGSYVDAEVDGEAMDMGDKATNKCMSIAHKYVLLQVFCIPTEDDKDPDSSTPPEIKSKPKEWMLTQTETDKIVELAAQAKMDLKAISQYIQTQFNKKSSEMNEREYLQVIDWLAKAAHSKELAPWEQDIEAGGRIK